MSGDGGFRLGTERQTHYAQRLLRESPYLTLLDAAADLLDRNPDELMRTPPGVEDASRTIEALERMQPGLEKPGRAVEQARAAPGVDGHAAGGTAESVAGGARRGPLYLTARHLRQIATGQRQAPAALDEDAAWVLERVSKALRVEALYATPATVPINGSEPITMDHVRAVFGEVSVIASMLGVSVPTVKAWGGVLPEVYGWKLEGLSEGRLRVPR